MGRHSARVMLEAAHAIAQFSSGAGALPSETDPPWVTELLWVADKSACPLET